MLRMRSAPCGVLTYEAGTIGGDLEMMTLVLAGSLDVLVRHAGAQGEWYTVAGSPVSLNAHGGVFPSGMRERLAEHLSAPGPVVDGNQKAASLAGFSA